MLITLLYYSSFQMRTLGTWRASDLYVPGQSWHGSPGACLLWPLSADVDTPGTFCRDRDVPKCRVGLNSLIELVSRWADCVSPEHLEAAACDVIRISAACSSGPSTGFLGAFSAGWRLGLCHRSLWK